MAHVSRVGLCIEDPRYIGSCKTGLGISWLYIAVAFWVEDIYIFFFIPATLHYGVKGR